MKKSFDEGDGKLADSRAIAQAITVHPFFVKDKKDVKRAMQFAGHIRAEVESRGKAAFDINLGFDEEKLLRDNLELVTRGLNLVHAEVKKFSGKAQGQEQQNQVVEALPGEPGLFFFQK